MTTVASGSRRDAFWNPCCLLPLDEAELFYEKQPDIGLELEVTEEIWKGQCVSMRLLWVQFVQFLGCNQTSAYDSYILQGFFLSACLISLSFIYD
jgi:hypothetical protein